MKNIFLFGYFYQEYSLFFQTRVSDLKLICVAFNDLYTQTENSKCYVNEK